MILKRRDRLPISQRVREILIPRKGIWRGLGYFNKRMRRLPDSPHRIALGFACGTLSGFSPLLGIHILMAMALSWALRGNMLAAAFGTAVCNPLTFPFMAAASLETGWRIVGGRPATPPQGYSAGWLARHWDQILVPYIVGGLVVGLVAAVVAYLLVAPAMRAYQERRRRRIAERARTRRAAIDAEQAAYAVSGEGGDG